MGIVVLGMYLLTWAIAALTLPGYLREFMVEQGAAFFAEHNPELSAAEVHAKLTEGAKQIDIGVTRILPVFPGVVIAWHEVSGPLGQTGTHRFGATIRTVFFVYGVGVKALASRTLESAP